MKKIGLVILFLSLSGCLQTRSELAEGEEKKVSQVSVIERQKADQGVEVEGLQAQNRSLNGRIEGLEHEIDMVAKAHDEQTQRIVALEARVKTLEEGVLQLGQEVETAKATPPPAVKKDGKERGSFEEGEDHFLQKEWKKAIAAYQKYREASPKGENIATATYKIGVCFQELKMNKEAKVFFDEVIERFPKTKSARAAGFRMNQLKKK